MREDFTPDKKLRAQNPQEGKQSRKTPVLKAALAGAALIAGVAELPRAEYAGSSAEIIASEALKKNDRLDRAADIRIENAIEAAAVRLKSERVQNAMKARGQDAMYAILHAVEGAVTREELPGTKFDVSELQSRYPMQIGFEKQTQSWSIHAPDEVRSMYATASYGNGFYLNDPSIFATNKHVFELAGKANEDKSTPFDATRMHLPKNYEAPADRVVIDDGTPTNGDIAGKLVVVVGIDPDATSDASGHKTYAGIAFPLPIDILKRQYSLARPDRVLQTDMSVAYGILLPKDEAVSTKGNEEFPAHGMSGSPVFAWNGASYKIAGMMGRAGLLFDGSKMVDAGFFVPIGAIRAVEAHESAFAINANKLDQ